MLVKKYTRKEIIEQNKDIKVIGYGSLLNDNTHHKKHTMKPAIFYGFKRVYNIKAFPFSPSKKCLKFAENYYKKYGITSKKALKQLSSSNTCVLNCVYTGNNKDFVNGLCLDIKAKDLKKYSIRESGYKLAETNFDYICPKIGNKTKTNEKAFVFVAKKKRILNEGTHFVNYHINTRNGSYNIGEYFGKLFDKTTYNIKGSLVQT